MDRYELAWAAGFFDGEGWAAAVVEEGRRTSQPKARVNQADGEGIPGVLVRFQAALDGLGRIAGPHREEARKDLYRWEVTSRADVDRLWNLLQPWLGIVKARELSSALGLVRVPTCPFEPLPEQWRAWAAGLFDGEGWCSMYPHRSHAGYMSGEIGVGQSAPIGTPEVLVRFASIVGVGRVYGPYEQEGATMPVFRWKAAAQRDVESTAERLWPWLSGVKRRQVQRVLDTLHSQLPLPRGNPDWGSDKKCCVHGHEYATARIRPYVARGGGTRRRENQMCLACLRDYARSQRDKKRSAADDDRRSLKEPAMRYLLK